MAQSATTAVQDLDALILRDLTSVPVQSHVTLWPLLWCLTWLFLSERPFQYLFFVSCHTTLCLFLLTSLTYFSKWAWRASHSNEGMCVCGQCLGRWDFLWDTLISSKPKPRHAGRYWTSEWNHILHPRLLLSGRVKSAPSFMAQSLLHPGVPNHLASIPCRWSLPGGLWGRKQWAAALPREPLEHAFCQPRVC